MCVRIMCIVVVHSLFVLNLNHCYFCLVDVDLIIIIVIIIGISNIVRFSNNIMVIVYY